MPRPMPSHADCSSTSFISQSPVRSSRRSSTYQPASGWREVNRAGNRPFRRFRYDRDRNEALRLACLAGLCRLNAEGAPPAVELVAVHTVSPGNLRHDHAGLQALGDDPRLVLFRPPAAALNSCDHLDPSKRFVPDGVCRGKLCSKRSMPEVLQKPNSRS
jgi:hypothetical protein